MRLCFVCSSMTKNFFFKGPDKAGGIILDGRILT